MTETGGVALASCMIRRASHLASTAIFLWSVLAPGLGSVLGSGLVYAQQNNAFTIVSVNVDITSKSSADARQKALAYGQRQAFERLMRRIVISGDLARVPKLTKSEIDEYVLDFAVVNEKNSPIRYLADLTYRFKARDIRGLLRGLEIRFAETLSKPVLLLPVYEAAAAKFLWDNPNPWREHLAQQALRDGLVPVTLPAADLRDIGLIGPEQALAGDEPRIKAIGLRYGVDTVMVTHATLSAGAGGRPSLRVNVISYGSDKRAGKLGFSAGQQRGETIEGLIQRAARLTVAKIEDRWKEDNLLQFEQDAVLAAAVPIGSLTEWVEVQRRLNRIAVIQKLDLVLFSRNEARINIYYLGDEEQLSLALAQADMQLRQDEGNWVLQLKGLAGRQGDRSGESRGEERRLSPRRRSLP
ncbi:MAG: DUF2066 domain-containing protein [Rhodospirillales bacterium]|nr:DUF2066 domain-containing protein [Rhodospirillales bacterium]